MDEPVRVRARVYFDGFNFYYGAFVDKNGGPSPRAAYKWLDLRRFCENVLPRTYDIGVIRYFTTPSFDAPAGNARTRQFTYLSALEEYSDITVHSDSHFERRTKKRRLANPENHTCGREKVTVSYLEEKGADVNLATHLLLDCFNEEFEVAVIVSDDSDLQGTVNAVIRNFHKDVVVINVRKRTNSYDGALEVFKASKPEYYTNNQLPLEIALSGGKTLRCPVAWGGP
ncbi:MAG: NYN domain-containing protein [Coriobacteriia bacterium]|nr:NYN domain-containing protein [Coriobacteriia bacterium]